MTPARTTNLGGRHYGLDWLRIGAFGLLILYHIGMVFVPWEFHIKTARPLDWVEWPMSFLNPWRLGLLFLISGVASRFLWAKLGGTRAFLASRTVRLFLPLVVGMALWVAPQPWVELRENGIDPGSFWQFWITDNFNVRPSFPEYKPGFMLPTWNHLWFVMYLWTYSALAALAAWALGGRSFQMVFDHVFAGWRLYLLPIAWLLTARLTLSTSFPENHGLIADPYAHMIYAGFFAFGLGLAGAHAILARLAASWRGLALVSLAAFAARVAYNLAYGDAATPPPEWLTALGQTARATHAWTTILALLGFATARLNFDAPARRYLAEAIFPFYIIHQTIIIVVQHWIKPAALGSTAEFALLLAATVAGCFVFYEIARRTGVLRPLFGLGRKPAA